MSKLLREVGQGEVQSASAGRKVESPVEAEEVRGESLAASVVKLPWVEGID
jgi:hypothetical protein